MNLRQIGDLGATILNQPGNNSIKERFKESFKRVLATRIRQSIERNGIDDMFKMSFNVAVSTMPNGFEGITKTRHRFVDYYKSNEQIPYPIRFTNDAPFTRITANGRALRYVTESELRLSITGNVKESSHALSLASTGGIRAYLWRNRNIIVVLDKRTPVGASTETISSINVESMWPDPEEFTMRLDPRNDGEEVTIPIADDLVNGIIQDILKVEYNLIPREPNVVMNPIQNTAGNA